MTAGNAGLESVYSLKTQQRGERPWASLLHAQSKSCLLGAFSSLTNMSLVWVSAPDHRHSPTPAPHRVVHEGPGWAPSGGGGWSFPTRGSWRKLSSFPRGRYSLAPCCNKDVLVPSPLGSVPGCRCLKTAPEGWLSSESALGRWKN